MASTSPAVTLSFAMSLTAPRTMRVSCFSDVGVAELFSIEPRIVAERDTPFSFAQSSTFLISVGGKRSAISGFLRLRAAPDVFAAGRKRLSY